MFPAGTEDPGKESLLEDKVHHLDSLSHAVDRRCRGSGSHRHRSRKQLLWDEYLIESLKDTRFVMNPATKATNNPVISRDKPWEGNYLHYTTVFYDEQEKQFRLWYSNRHLKPVAGDNLETQVGFCGNLPTSSRI